MTSEDSPEETVLRISIDHLLEGVQVIGYDWRYRYVNASAAEHGERPVEAVLRRTMMEVYPRIDKGVSTGCEVFVSALAGVIGCRRRS